MSARTGETADADNSSVYFFCILFLSVYLAANIVSLHQVLSSSKHLYMVMDLVTGGELFDLVAAKKRLPEDQARSFFQQLVDGVEYCHSRRVYHRDLKPENLMLSEDKLTLKITDFGLSSIKKENSTSELLHTIMGSPHYISPEIIMSAADGYEGSKVDTWASGMILYGMLAGYLPFDQSDLPELYRAIVRDPVDYPNHFSPAVVALLSSMLEKDPAQRADLSQVKDFPWFQLNYHPPKPLDTPRAAEEKVPKRERRRHRKKRLGGLGSKSSSRLGGGGSPAEDPVDDLAGQDPSLEDGLIVRIKSMDGQPAEKPQTSPPTKASGDGKQRRIRSRLGRRSTRESSDVPRKNLLSRREGRESRQRDTSRDRASYKLDASSQGLHRSRSAVDASEEDDAEDDASVPWSSGPLGAVQKRKSLTARKKSDFVSPKANRRGFLSVLPGRRRGKKSFGAVGEASSSAAESFGNLRGSAAALNASNASELDDSGLVPFTHKFSDRDDNDRGDDKRRSRTLRNWNVGGLAKAGGMSGGESPRSELGRSESKSSPKNRLDVSDALFASLTSPTSPGGNLFDGDDLQGVQSLPAKAFKSPTGNADFVIGPRKKAVYSKAVRQFTPVSNAGASLDSPGIRLIPDEEADGCAIGEVVPQRQKLTDRPRTNSSGNSFLKTKKASEDAAGVPDDSIPVAEDAGVVPELAGGQEREDEDQPKTTAVDSVIFKPSSFDLSSLERTDSEVPETPHVLCPSLFVDDENDEYAQWSLDSNELFADAEEEPLRVLQNEDNKLQNEENKRNSMPIEAAPGKQLKVDPAPKSIFAPLSSQLRRNLSLKTAEISLENSLGKRQPSITKRGE